jgi:hypothetical protein
MTEGMRSLSETEIFACLSENFRLAAEDCEKLAWQAKRGSTYKRLMDELKLCEGACRQVAQFRGDARWLQIGLQMHEAHTRAGRWLRMYIAKDSRKVAHPLFQKLAECLRWGQANAEKMRTAATGRVGLILPKPLPAPHRPVRPVQVLNPTGLILPWSNQWQ